MNKDVTQLAQKQRHLSLLERVRSNKTLSKAELTELAGYEKNARRTPLPVPAPSNRKRPKDVKGKSKRGRLISVIELRRLAFNSESMAEADVVTRFRRPLADVIAADAELKAAWERGQFLRKLEKAASLAQSLSQAATWLKVPGGGPELRRMLDSDDEARDLWDQAWLAAEMDVKTAIIDAAKAGNAQAIKTVETWLRTDSSQSAGGKVNFARVTMMQLTEVFGVSRQSLDIWVRTKSCPRNADGTFRLRDVVEWFERYVEAKSGGGGKAADIDPMRTLKTRKIEMELDQRLGRLLDRDSVIAGQVARFQVLANSLSALGRDVAPMLENQPLLRIREILENWRLNVLNEQKRIPAEIDLPEGAAESLTECYEQLL